LLLRAWELRHQAPREALVLNQQAYQLAWQQQHLPGLAYALLRLAVCNLILGEAPVLVRHQVDHGLQLMADLGDLRGLAEAWNLSANVLARQSQVTAALDHQMRALNFARQAGDAAAEAMSLSNVTLYLLRMQRLPEALEMALATLKFARQQADHSREAYALSRIAQVFVGLGDHEAAVDHLERCMSLLRSGSNLAFQSTVRVLLATSLLALKQVESAAAQAVEASRLAEQVSNVADRANALLALGATALAAAAPTLALQHLQHAESLLRPVDDVEQLRSVLLHLGEAWYALQDTDQAHACWLEALHLSQASGDLSVRMQAHHQLAASYEAMGQFEAALRHLRAWSEQREQLRGQAVQHRIREVLKRAADTGLM
jgi:tetratricopeptide (TPR) repeat protein